MKCFSKCMFVIVILFFGLQETNAITMAQCNANLQSTKEYCESSMPGILTQRIQWPMNYNPDGSGVLNITELCYYNPMSVAANRVYATECYVDYPAIPQSPPPPPPEPGACAQGSVIRIEEGSVGENVSIVGTPFQLVYSSERTLGNLKAYKLPLLATVSPISYSGAEFTIIYGNGRQDNFSLSPGLATNLVWDGKDASGNYVEAPTRAQTSTFINYSGTLDDVMRSDFTVGTWNLAVMGLGGWNFDIHHRLDVTSSKFYKGDGSIKTGVIFTQADASTYRAIIRGEEDEIYYFDLSGRHLTTNDFRTNAVKYTFNYLANGYLSSIVDSYGNTTSVIRNGSGVLTGIQAPFGQVTTLSLGSDGYLASIQNPKGETYSMTYYAGGLLHTFQTPRGQISTMTYDSDGNLTLDSSSAGNFTSLAMAITGFDKTINLSDALGAKSTFNINQNNGGYSRAQSSRTGESISHSFTPSSGLSYSYNTEDYGSVTYAQDPRFGVFLAIQTMVNGINRTVAGVNTITKSISQNVTNTSSTPTPFNYDSLQTNIDVNGMVTTATYDRVTSVDTIRSPVNRYQYITTDTHGKVVNYKYANFLPTQYSYDTFGRLRYITQGTRQSEIQYDSLGNVQSFKNPLNQTTNFTYDLAGQVLTTTLPDSKVIVYSYDDNGNVTGIAPPGRSTHVFDFNAFDLPEKYIPPTLSPSVGYTQYTYDNAKRITQIIKPDLSQVNFYYDSVTSLLSSVVASGDTTQFVFSPNGSISSTTSQDGIQTGQNVKAGFMVSSTTTNSANVNIGSLSYTYNTDLKPSNLTVTSQGTVNSSINYAYDNDGLLKTAGSLAISLDGTTGIPTKTTLNKIQEIYSYDSSYGEPLSMLAKYVNGSTVTNLFSQSYARDSLGRIATKIETVGAITNQFDYTYDSTGRLTDVTKNSAAYSHYNFDSNSNVNSGNVGGSTFVATYDDQDRLLTYNSNSFTYSANGEMKSKTVNGVTTNYTYNGFGMLKTAKVGTGAVQTYLYDGFNRLVGKKSGSTVQKYWVYQDQLRIAAELNASGTITKKFIYGTKANVPDYMVIGSTTYKIVSDHLGSVRLVVNAANGVISQQIEYNELGAVISDTSPGFQPFYFAGGVYDTTTKLLHFGARDYDPSIGRWLSKDPIGFDGGYNFYEYSFSDPINYFDDDGMAPKSGMARDTGGGGPSLGRGGSFGGGGGGGRGGSGGTGAGGSGGSSCPIQQDTVFVAPNGQAVMGYKGGTVGPANNGNGLKITNGNTEIRLMGPTNLYNNGYGRINNGQYRDAFGNAVPKNAPAGHILPPLPWGGN